MNVFLLNSKPKKPICTYAKEGIPYVSKYEAIMEAMEDAETAISSLNKSEDEMIKSKNDILDMLQTLSAIAEENAASTQEASSAMLEQGASMDGIAQSSEKLARLAESLQEIIMKFIA